MRRIVRLGSWVGIGAALALGLRQAWRWFQEVGSPPPPPSWPKVPVPAPESGTGGQATLADEVDPDEGRCPSTHPVKAKLRSHLYHLPGMAAYERTLADRCFVDAGAAEAAGFSRAKR